MRRKKTRKRILILGAALLFASCVHQPDSGDCPDTGALYKVSTSCAATAVQQWQWREPAVYTYTLRRGCFCDPTYVGPFLVDAYKDSVTRVRRVASLGDTVSVTFNIQRYSIDTLFAEIKSHATRPYASIEARYDSTFFFPAYFQVDHYVMMADDEYGFTVTDFRNLAD